MSNFDFGARYNWQFQENFEVIFNSDNSNLKFIPIFKFV